MSSFDSHQKHIYNIFHKREEIKNMNKQEEKKTNKIRKRYQEGGVLDRVRTIFLTEYILKNLCLPVNENYNSILINELGVKDPKEISYIITYLIWKGYFSQNKEFKFSLDREIIYGLYGIDVIEGQGVCLNIATILCDVLKKLNMDAFLVSCNTDKISKINDELQFDIERNKNENTSIKHRFLDIFPMLLKISDHIVVAVHENDKYFLVDPTNLAFMNFDDFLQARYIGISTKVPLQVYGTYFTEFSKSGEDIVNFFIESYKKRAIITHEVAKTHQEQASDLCRRESALFDDFHNEIHSDIDETVKFLRLNKNIKKSKYAK